MRVKLYSSSRPQQQPVYLDEEQIKNPTLETIQDIINVTAAPGLTLKGFFVALTLWLLVAADAIQITALGFLIAAFQVPVLDQPKPFPSWLFPDTNFSLTNFQCGVFSSSVYLFMLFGGLLSSPLDKFNGSRPALLLCCAAGLLAHIGAAESPNWIVLTVCQSIIGLSLGVRIPIIYSNLATLFPSSNLGGFVLTTASLVWVLGSMYAAGSGWVVIGDIFHLSWRVYMLILAIPSLLALILGLFFVYEPIHYAFFVQHRLNPVLALMKLHYGPVLSQRCQKFWINIFCCCGLFCRKNQFGNSQILRYGTIEDDTYSINSNSSIGYRYDGHLSHNLNSPSKSTKSKHSSSTTMSHDTNDDNGFYSSPFGQNNNNNGLGLNRFDNDDQSSILTTSTNTTTNENELNNGYRRTRKPSMFQDEFHFHATSTPAESYQLSQFDHEKYLPADFQVQFHHYPHNDIMLDSANTVYNNDSRPGSLDTDGNNVLTHYPPPPRLSIDPSSIPNQTNHIPTPQKQNHNTNINANNISINSSGHAGSYNNQTISASMIDNHYITSPRNSNNNNNNNNKTNERPMLQGGIIYNRDDPFQSSYDSSSFQPEYTTTTSNGQDMIIDWNIDIDNTLNMEEFFDFITKQWSNYTLQLQYHEYKASLEKKRNGKSFAPVEQQNNIHQLQQIQDLQQLQYHEHKHDNVSSLLYDSYQSDYDPTASTSLSTSPSSLSATNIPRSLSNIQHSSSMSNKDEVQQQQQQQQDQPSTLFLIIVLSTIWFIVSFASSGFTSFLPTLWNLIIPKEKQKIDDIDFIVSFIYSAIQLPAGIFNIIAISRIFPPRLLLSGVIITFISSILLTSVFQYSPVASMIFVFTSQFGMSTCWCAVNYVALQYFPDDKKVFAFAIQASMGKFGAFIAQYVFALLLNVSPLVLMIVVSALNLISVLCCWWFFIVVKDLNSNQNSLLTKQ